MFIFVFMKVNKTQALMYILMCLLQKGYIKKEDIIFALEINDLTFRRYMQELRAFLYNFNYGCDIKYSKSTSKYTLTKS